MAKLVGMKGPDTITGLEGGDISELLKGDDVVFGLNGNDYFYGGQGRDPVEGGSGNDRMHSEPGTLRQPHGTRGPWRGHRLERPALVAAMTKVFVEIGSSVSRRSRAR